MIVCTLAISCEPFDAPDNGIVVWLDENKQIMISCLPGFIINEASPVGASTFGTVCSDSKYTPPVPDHLACAGESTMNCIAFLIACVKHIIPQLITITNYLV